jgi:hypothetical protein
MATIASNNNTRCYINGIQLTLNEVKLLALLGKEIHIIEYFRASLNEYDLMIRSQEVDWNPLKIICLTYLAEKTDFPATVKAFAEVIPLMNMVGSENEDHIFQTNIIPLIEK